MNLPSGNVQETLFVPLWGRAFASGNYPDLLYDPESVRIVNETGYDFSSIGESGEYYCLASAVRAVNFDNEIRSYLYRWPEASVVSIGSGLDTTFFRVDNGRLKWYDLDLPEIIELRRRYIRQDERAVQIAQSCFDYSWTAEVDYAPDKGLIFIVGGVFYYFTGEQVNDFIIKTAMQFPGAQMVFDITTKAGLKVSNRYVRKTVNRGAEMHFSFDDAKKYFSAISPDIKVSEQYPFYSRIERDRNWSRDTRFKMKFSDLFRMVNLIRLELG